MLLLVLVMNLLAASPAWAQCAMCRASVESNAQTGNTDTAQNLNTGILYLMSLPYIIFGTIGLLWYRNSRKKKAARLAQKAQGARLRPAAGY